MEDGTAQLGGAEARTASTADPMKYAFYEEEHARPGLVVIHPRALDETTRVFRVSGSMVVGRSRGSQIALDDPHVSRRHAEVWIDGNGLWIRDLGSRHGSRVGGLPVGGDALLVAPGSIIRFGETLLLVVADVERYRGKPLRISGSVLGLPREVVAGPSLSEIWDQATRAAAAIPYPILVLGESGTGKECIARLVHRALGAERPFVGINLAAIPAALFETELFGHERGAFTGASVGRLGAFREADGGLLFLDEVAELQPELQAKLLRALDLEVVRPLGSNREVAVQTRIVAATSRDLRAACDQGTFRRDLYHRLAGVVIRVPPLRERPDDVMLLTRAMLDAEAPNLRLSADAAEQLALASWDGNVRALRSAVIRAANSASAISSGAIVPAQLPKLATARPPAMQLSELEIRAAMSRAGGVAAKAAEVLGVSRTTFYNTCRRLGIDSSALRAEQTGSVQ